MRLLNSFFVVWAVLLMANGLYAQESVGIELELQEIFETGNNEDLEQFINKIDREKYPHIANVAKFYYAQHRFLDTLDKKYMGDFIVYAGENFKLGADPYFVGLHSALAFYFLEDYESSMAFLGQLKKNDYERIKKDPKYHILLLLRLLDVLGEVKKRNAMAFKLMTEQPATMEWPDIFLIYINRCVMKAKRTM